MGFRLSAFYFTFFVYGGAYVAYFPLYLANRGLSAVEIAWVLALPPLARTFAPAAWGWLADASGAHRGIVVFS
jgi:PPP family 3-phenylpropionic acid transporter